MSLVSIIGLALVFIGVAVGLAVGLLCLLDWWNDRREAARLVEADLAYQASLRAWRLHQQEFDTEQRIRQATRQAMEQMVQLARTENPNAANRQARS